MKTLAFFPLMAAVHPLAGGVPGLSDPDVARGLKEALTQGVGKAIGALSAKDGFLGNPKVKIPLPPALAKVEKTLRTFGMGDDADALVTTMNRAAEAAVTEAKPILLDSLKRMTLDDARALLSGAPDAATAFFRTHSREAIVAKFLPRVKAATAKVKVAEDYEKLAGPAARFGLIDAQDADLDAYITHRAVDGLFQMMAEEEKAIRANPMGQASKLLQKVFG